MSSPSGMSPRRETLSVSPSDSKSALRLVARHAPRARTAGPRRRSSPSRPRSARRSSGVMAARRCRSRTGTSRCGRCARRRSASPGHSRFTASAITCSAEWRITSPPSGSRAVIDREAAAAAQRQRAGRRAAPSTLAGERAVPSPAPIRSATSSDGRAAGTRSVPAVRQLELNLSRGAHAISRIDRLSIGRTRLVGTGGLNRRPLPCQGSALPLSYVPVNQRAKYQFGLGVSIWGRAGGEHLGRDRVDLDLEARAARAASSGLSAKPSKRTRVSFSCSARAQRGHHLEGRPWGWSSRTSARRAPSCCRSAGARTAPGRGS